MVTVVGMESVTVSNWSRTSEDWEKLNPNDQVLGRVGERGIGRRTDEPVPLSVRLLWLVRLAASEEVLGMVVVRTLWGDRHVEGAMMVW